MRRHFWKFWRRIHISMNGLTYVTLNYIRKNKLVGQSTNYILQNNWSNENFDKGNH